jgi:hypothetical protein
MDLKQISLRVSTCIILHNMLVSDRVMGQCGVVYNPSHILQENEDEVDHVHQPEDLAAVQGGDPDCAGVSGVGIRNAPRAARDVVTRSGRFKQLNDKSEHQRLHAALSSRFA